MEDAPNIIQAGQKLADALDLAQQLSHPHTTVLVNTIAAFLNFQFGDMLASQQHLDVSIPQSAEHGFSCWLAQNEIQQGVVWVEQGNLAQGIDTLRQGIDNYQDTGSDIGLPDALSSLAAAYGKCGHPEQALKLMSQVMELVDNDKEISTRCELYRNKGDVLQQTATGNDTQIEACYRQAPELAGRQNLKIFQLRAVVRLGYLWQNQGKIEQARDGVNKIYGTFTEGFDTKDLQEAGVLLQNL